jgi:hypothetical protein
MLGSLWRLYERDKAPEDDVQRAKTLMQRDKYKGYAIWGHAIREQHGILDQVKYAASGTVTLEGKFVEASGALDIFESEEDAQQCGMTWARAWVDNHT